MRRVILAVICFVIGLASSAVAQTAPSQSDLAKTELNKLDSIVNHTAAIKDSISSRLRLLKDSISQNPAARATLLKDVLNLEGELFDAESASAKAQAQKNIFVQTQLITDIDKRESVQANKTEVGDILNITQISENISDSERKLLQSEVDIDNLYKQSSEQMNKHYQGLLKLDTLLKGVGVDISVADSLAHLADSIYNVSSQLDNKFNTEWVDLFDTKIYIYSRILEKLGASQNTLVRLGDRSRDMRAELSQITPKLFAPNLYSYIDEKKLAQEYEKAVVKMLGNINVTDSIDSSIKNSALARYDTPKIEIPNYQYADFEEIKIFKAFVSKDDDIRTIVVPTVGEIYMNRAVTLKNPLSQTSILRKVTPLYKMVNAKNMTEYYTGVYHSAEEAKSDLKRLSGLGLRPATTKFVGDARVASDGTTYPVDAADYLFSLEFKFMDSALEEKLAELAPNKQITKIDDIYTFGVFDSYNEIEAIAKELWVENKIVKIKKP